MVQEFQVLRCFSCHSFQVHQVRKSKTWSCKLCGEKQSLIKVYGQGSGADCRRHVQKLNLLQGEVGQAASSTAGQNGQNAISDSDNDDDTQQRLVVSQETATMSRWNKYLEEKSDNTCEEEETLIYPDQEHFFSQQENTLSAIRKRKKIPEYGCGFDDQDIKGVVTNISKKNKICEDSVVSTPGAIQPSCIKTEGSSGYHGRAVSHTSPVAAQSCSESRWERFLSISKPEETFEENISSTSSFYKMKPGMDVVLNKMTHVKELGPGWRSPGGGGHHPIEIKPLHAQNRVSSTDVEETDLNSHQQTDCIPEPSTSSSPPKPFTPSTLFQTDDDFDDDY